MPPPPPPSDEVRVHVRIAPELKVRLRRVIEITGLDEAAIVRACLESVVEYFNQHGEITLPLAVIPKSEVRTAVAQTEKVVPIAAEDSAQYAAQPKKRKTGCN